VGEDKSHRGAAGQFFVAAELCRRELVAVLTLGNCPNTDVLVSNKAGTAFAHVQVKTYRPGRDKTCSVGMKSEKNYGPGFFWVLAGIPLKNSKADFEYFVIPSPVFSKLMREGHEVWMKTPGMKGQQHNESKVRAIAIPPKLTRTGESIEGYRNRWDLISKCCECD
jgi:hypothetical protein